MSCPVTGSKSNSVRSASHVRAASETITRSKQGEVIEGFIARGCRDESQERFSNADPDEILGIALLQLVKSQVVGVEGPHLRHCIDLKTEAHVEELHISLQELIRPRSLSEDLTGRVEQPSLQVRESPAPVAGAG